MERIELAVKIAEWQPAMLILDLAITPEDHTLPILAHSSQSGEQTGFRMSVEIEGKVSSAGYACWSGNWCLDESIVSPIYMCFAAISDNGSPYTSCTSISSMRSGAKGIAELWKARGIELQ